MKKYKKGDWVIFPEFNEFAVQLEENGQYGFTDSSLSLAFFAKATEKFCKEAGVKRVYCVKDPRYSIWGKRYGWVEVSRVRPAKPSDLNKITRNLKKIINTSKKELKKYVTARQNLVK